MGQHVAAGPEERRTAARSPPRRGAFYASATRRRSLVASEGRRQRILRAVEDLKRGRHHGNLPTDALVGAVFNSTLPEIERTLTASVAEPRRTIGERAQISRRTGVRNTPVYNFRKHVGEIKTRFEQVLAIGQMGAIEARLEIERADDLLVRIAATHAYHAAWPHGTPVRRAIMHNEARRCLSAVRSATDPDVRKALHERALALAIEAELL
jgi:hypothetical protein